MDSDDLRGSLDRDRAVGYAYRTLRHAHDTSWYVTCYTRANSPRSNY